MLPEAYRPAALLLGLPALTPATVLASLLVFGGIGTSQGRRLAEAPVAGLVRAFGGCSPSSAPSPGSARRCSTA
jgi:hypothetical protein